MFHGILYLFIRFNSILIKRIFRYCVQLKLRNFWLAYKLNANLQLFGGGVMEEVNTWQFFCIVNSKANASNISSRSKWSLDRMHKNRERLNKLRLISIFLTFFSDFTGLYEQWKWFKQFLYLSSMTFKWLQMNFATVFSYDRTRTHKVLKQPVDHDAFVHMILVVLCFFFNFSIENW